MRTRLLLLLAIVAPLGFATKFYGGPGETWIRAHAGGLLYVLFWSLSILAVRPRLSAWKVAGAILALTSVLEFLQLWNARPLARVRQTFLGHALIGSSFSWSDFPWYAAGAAAAVGLAALCRPHRSRPQSAHSDSRSSLS